MKTLKNYKILWYVLLLIVLSALSYFFLQIHRDDPISSIGEVSNTDYVDSLTPNSISTLVVPHHDLVMDKRRAVFTEAAKKTNPKTVILVSPNHFDTGSDLIQTTDRTWTLQDGKLLPDKTKISSLEKSGDAVLSDTAFNGEHGIANILDDIYSTFPNSELVPIIIKPNASKDSIVSLGKELYSLCSSDCLLVASVDDSHYQSGALAELHDDLTIRALNNLDNDLIWQAEVDSNQSLALAINWAKLNSTPKFNLFDHTNSDKLASDRDGESTSYIFGWYEQGDQNALTKNQISFMVGGDAMFARNINYNFPDNKIYDAWSEFGQRVFWGTDLAMLNLEGPISAKATPPVSDHTMNFNFPPKVPDLLSWLHINAVSLANNHSLNQGESGFANTVKVLKAADITPIGKEGVFNADSIARFQSGDAKLSVISIEPLEVTTDIASYIKAEKAAGAKVLVIPHWGTEYEAIHNSSQAKLAHSWINAGADIVIGGHPHVVEDAELYNGKPIFYSLGNLLFDQTFSKETQRGLIVAGEFNGDKLTLTLLPTKSVNMKPSLLTGAEKTDLISSLRKNLGLPTTDTGYGFDKIEI